MLAAFALTFTLSAMIEGMIDPYHRTNSMGISIQLWRMTALSAPLFAALLTRRSAFPVFLGATVISMIPLWPGIPIMPKYGMIDMLTMAAVMYCLTQIGSLAGSSSLRASSERMRPRMWIPVTAIAIAALPILMGFMGRGSRNGDGVIIMTAIGAMLFVPMAIALLKGWACAIGMDALMVYINRRRPTANDQID